jgi:Holliday junction resolvasome RuvABC endonuclease subunit|tara:strand:- start:544 stop:1002 length:459 start_codon:yes stop_codon:yes gene_type:complete
MRVVSIDPGLRNFGYAIVQDGNLIAFDSICIWDLVPKKKRTDYPYIARVLVENTDIFRGADYVLIERQMQSRMKMIACALRCFFWDKSQMVAPISVRKHFKISTGVYKKNKKASIALVPKFFDEKQMKRFMAHKKKDDIADAVLMAMYFIKK